MTLEQPTCLPPCQERAEQWRAPLRQHNKPTHKNTTERPHEDRSDQQRDQQRVIAMRRMGSATRSLSCIIPEKRNRRRTFAELSANFRSFVYELAFWRSLDALGYSLSHYCVLHLFAHPLIVSSAHLPGDGAIPAASFRQAPSVFVRRQCPEQQGRSACEKSRRNAGAQRGMTKHDGGWRATSFLFFRGNVTLHDRKERRRES